MKYVLRKCLLILVFCFIKIFSQTNEIALATSIIKIGVTYEKLSEKRLSFGASFGTGLLSPKHDQFSISDTSSQKADLTKFYFAPFARYYFLDGSFGKAFLMIEYLYDSSSRTNFSDNRKTGTENIVLHGPLAGAGYKFIKSSRLSFTAFLTMGYDLNENDFIPVLANGFLSVGYRF